MSGLPKRFPDRKPIADVLRLARRKEPGEFMGTTRRIAGRVMAQRDMGKVVFLDLVDRSGTIQLFCPVNIAPVASELHLGDVVGVTGAPGRTKRAEASMLVVELELLARFLRALPDTLHGLTDVEQL